MIIVKKMSLKINSSLLINFSYEIFIPKKKNEIISSKKKLILITNKNSYSDQNETNHQI